MLWALEKREVDINKKILLTGGRSIFALDLARRLHEQGHLVYVADTSLHHVSRYSNAIKGNFVIPSPRFQSEKFIEALVDICRENQIDFVLPTFEEIFCLSKGMDRFPKSCTVFCENYNALDHLHNKWLFNQKIQSMGFDTPRSYLISSHEELEKLPLKAPYILKPSYSRSSTKVIKVSSSTLPRVSINPHNPLVAQEYLSGRKFCSYSIAHNGKLAAHTVYPVEFSKDGNFCLNFEAITHPKIENWIKTFVLKENFTGQIAFDFIEHQTGKLYAIECNPRGTSGLHLFQEKDNLPLAFFNKHQSCITPTVGYSKKIAWGMLIYGWKTRSVIQFIKKFITIKDVVFSTKDLKPALHQPLLFIIYLFRSLKLRKRLPATFTHDIDWNGHEISQLNQTIHEPLQESSPSCTITKALRS